MMMMTAAVPALNWKTVQEIMMVLLVQQLLLLKRYLDHHYNLALSKNRQSGSHADMHNFCEQKPYLYLYHILLVETDSVVLKRQVVTDLPEDAVHDSNAPTSSTKKKKKTPKKRRIGNNGSVASSHKTSQTCFERVSETMDGYIGMKAAVLKESQADVKETQGKEKGRKLQKELGGILKEISNQKRRLKDMQEDSDYDSDNSDAVVEKELFASLKGTRDDIRQDLRNHDQLKEDKELGHDQSPVRCIQYGRGSDCSTL
jgi:hypothetical protein